MPFLTMRVSKGLVCLLLLATGVPATARAQQSLPRASEPDYGQVAPPGYVPLDDAEESYLAPPPVTGAPDAGPPPLTPPSSPPPPVVPGSPSTITVTPATRTPEPPRPPRPPPIPREGLYVSGFIAALPIGHAEVTGGDAGNQEYSTDASVGFGALAAWNLRSIGFGGVVRGLFAVPESGGYTERMVDIGALARPKYTFRGGELFGRAELGLSWDAIKVDAVGSERFASAGLFTALAGGMAIGAGPIDVVADLALVYHRHRWSDARIAGNAHTTHSAQLLLELGVAWGSRPARRPASEQARSEPAGEATEAATEPSEGDAAEPEGDTPAAESAGSAEDAEAPPSDGSDAGAGPTDLPGTDAAAGGADGAGPSATDGASAPPAGA